VVSLAIGIWKDGFTYGWIDGLSIMIAVAIITIVNTVNERAKLMQFRKLMEAGETVICYVIKDGKQCKVDSEQLVVGDIIIVEAGKKLPADVILISAEDVDCDESDLTGESLPVRKDICTEGNLFDNPCPFLFKNTICVNGSGKAVVVAVGQNTNIGQIENLMVFEDEPTPLQEKLERVVVTIGYVGLAAAALTFVTMVTRLIFNIFVYKNRTLTDKDNIADILDAFIVAVTVVVMAIPEGLPLAVAICLAFSVGKLQEEHGV